MLRYLRSKEKMLFKILFCIIKHRKPTKKETQSFFECQKSSFDDDCDLKLCQRPIIYFLIQIWGIIETMLLFVLLYLQKGEYARNFLNELCKSRECARFISEAIAVKIASSVLLTIGSILVSRRSFLFKFVNQTSID